MPRKLPVDPSEHIKIHRQKIERIVLTGDNDHVDEAFQYCVTHQYLMAQLGPKHLSQRLRDEKKFVLVAEKVLR